MWNKCAVNRLSFRFLRPAAVHGWCPLFRTWEILQFRRFGIIFSCSTKKIGSHYFEFFQQLSGLDDAFRTFYVCTAVRKFFFFLDPLRAGRVRICDILACGFLDSILELREASTTQARLEENWFSLESAKRVYASYLRLDTDQNGMLSRKELAG